MTQASQFPAISERAHRMYGRSGSGLWNDQLLDTYVRQWADATPDADALVEGATRLTYADLNRLVTEAAGGLRALGLTRGDVASFQLPNWWEALVLHLALVRIGAVSNPLMPVLREREMRYMLGKSRSRLLITADHFRGFDHGALARGLQGDLGHLETVVTVRGESGGGPTFEDLLGTPADGTPEPDRRPDDPVVLLYTSGTESNPKGALHSHNTLGYEDRSIIDHFGLTSADVVFMPSPVAHITGVLYGFHLATMLGTKVVYQDVWEAGEGLTLIERERCSFTVAATPFLHGLTYHERLSNHDVSSLRIFACGGADVPPDLIRDAGKRLGCCAVRVYGSTEFPTLSAGHPSDAEDLRATTDGRPIGHAEARILDDAGAAVAPGIVGNLSVRGPEAFIGYLGEASPAIDPDGWFETGDLASIDAAGFVRIAGRTKDIIIRGGENISVKEIEDLLYAHPDVADVAIVAMPDPRLVERACAVVVPVLGTSLTLAAIAEYLNGFNLARHKYPERLELVDSLPRTPTGKIQKYVLRQLVQERLAAH
jgi:cyclohexanecarboxylate-CoA ligase